MAVVLLVIGNTADGWRDLVEQVDGNVGPQEATKPKGIAEKVPMLIWSTSCASIIHSRRRSRESSLEPHLKVNPVVSEEGPKDLEREGKGKIFSLCVTGTVRGMIGVFVFHMAGSKTIQIEIRRLGK